MTSMKCRYYSKIYETNCKITKYISVYKLQQKKMRLIVSRDTHNNINHFSAIPKTDAILEPTQKGNQKNLYLANLDRRYPGNNDKDMEMPDVKHITSICDSYISERISSI